jgi:Tol biopolymer transport system component
MTLMLVSGVAMVGAGSFMEARQADAAEQAFEAARRLEVVDRDLRGALANYRDIVSRYPSNRAVVANTLVRMAAVYQQLGQPEAMPTLQRVVRDFADQPAAVAAAKAAIDAARPSAAAQTTLVRRLVYEESGGWMGLVVSPDGRLVLGRSGPRKRDLILRTLPVKDDRVLFPATGTTTSWNPVFSPNGTMVAFQWTEYQGDVRLTSVGVVSTSPNAVPRRITDAVAGSVDRFTPIAWSADGASVIVRTAEFSSEGRTTPSTLDWVSVASGVITRSIPFSVQNELPVMSPSGDYFAYEKASTATRPATESRIYTIDSSGRNETEVVRIAGRHRSPVWTPDGSAILFLSNRTGRDGLWAVRIRNGQAASQAVLVQDSLASGVALGGVTIDGTVYLREALPERPHVFISERGAPGARGLRAYSGGGGSWSPDGASVAFAKSEGAGQGASLIIKNVATGDERQFDHPNRLGSPHVRWSRDGASILVFIREAGHHIFDVRSGQFRQIPSAHGRVRAGVADFSPDGKTIYVASRPAGAAAKDVWFTELVSVDVATGEERTLADLSAVGHYGEWGLSPMIAVSPDGQSVALQVRLAPQGSRTVAILRLVLVAADGSGWRFLSEPYRLDNDFGAIAWTPDGQSVLFFTRSVLPMTWRLMRVSAGGGEPVSDGLEMTTLQNDSSLPQLAPFPPFSLAVSPDGSRVAFGAEAGSSSQLVALDNVNAVIARAR